MKIAFYTSGKATRFVKAIEMGKKDFCESVKVLISEDIIPDDSQKILKDKGISFVHIPYKGNREDWSDNICSVLYNNNVDYLFCNGRHILAGKLLNEFSNKIINFHAGLLPLYKGKNQVDEMLKDNLFLVGTSAHFVVEEVDAGPIIMESITPGRAFAIDGYDAVLQPQINMIHKIFYLLKDSRIHLQEGIVIIDGADYMKSQIFPYV